LAVKPRRPFSTTVGVFIVVLAVLGSAHSFLWEGGVRFYADRPLRILFVVGSSAVFTMVIWFAARRFPSFSPLLHALCLVVVALGLSAGAVVAAYATARLWSDEVVLGAIRWAGVGFAAATNVVLGSNVASIDGWTFGYCSNLTDITIPNSVASIGAFGFRDCTSLAIITMPDSVTYIGGYALSALPFPTVS
jgi:hypothetical protein